MEIVLISYFSSSNDDLDDCLLLPTFDDNELAIGRASDDKNLLSKCEFSLNLNLNLTNLNRANRDVFIDWPTKKNIFRKQKSPRLQSHTKVQLKKFGENLQMLKMINVVKAGPDSFHWKIFTGWLKD